MTHPFTPPEHEPLSANRSHAAQDGFSLCLGQAPAGVRPLLVSAHDTSRLIYRQLASQWPGTSFLVRTSDGRRPSSGPCAAGNGLAHSAVPHLDPPQFDRRVEVRWTDGPNLSEVTATAALFHGVEYEARLGRWFRQESLLMMPNGGTGDAWPPVLVRYDISLPELHRRLSRGYQQDLLACARVLGFTGSGRARVTRWGVTLDRPRPVAKFFSALLSPESARRGAQLAQPESRREFLRHALDQGEPCW